MHLPSVGTTVLKVVDRGSKDYPEGCSDFGTSGDPTLRRRCLMVLVSRVRESHHARIYDAGWNGKVTRGSINAWSLFACNTSWRAGNDERENHVYAIALHHFPG